MSRPNFGGDRCTVIESIATANPPYSVTQMEAAEFMLRTSGISSPLRKRIPQVYERSGIDRRYSCLEDYVREPSDFEFYPKSPALCPAPSTAARNAVYKRESVPLAADAAAACLIDASISPADVTHLIVVTCTGFFAPGLDILLVKQLGLKPSTERTVIGFMGCYAAFNGLKAAHNICGSNPDAVVMLVCVELCTLHFQIVDSLESVIVNAIFSDGAAACLLRSASSDDTAGKLIYRAGATALGDGSLDAMSWEIGDTGFMMGLSPKVPELISDDLPDFVTSFIRKNALTEQDIDFWAIHPGGRQILDRTVSALNLPSAKIEDSYAVLREYGNMSSPTILFILKRILDNREARSYDRGMALAFGPGLTIEACLLEFGSRSSV